MVLCYFEFYRTAIISKKTNFDLYNNRRIMQIQKKLNYCCPVKLKTA